MVQVQEPLSIENGESILTSNDENPDVVLPDRWCFPFHIRGGHDRGHTVVSAEGPGGHPTAFVRDQPPGRRAKQSRQGSHGRSELDPKPRGQYMPAIDKSEEDGTSTVAPGGHWWRPGNGLRGRSHVGMGEGCG